MIDRDNRFLAWLRDLSRHLIGSDRLDRALMESVDSWNHSRSRSLLWLGADPNFACTDLRSMPLLCVAARMGADEALQALLDFGADPNCAPPGLQHQWTPIHHAALKGRSSAIRILASRGANVSAIVSPGWAPLFIAARENKADAILALASLGADPEQPDLSCNEAPLMLCARRGFLESASALLSLGCDPSIRTPEGATPMHLAAAGGFLEICEALAAHGADPCAPGPFGRTPIQVARGESHEALACRLEALALERSPAASDSTPGSRARAWL